MRLSLSLAFGLLGAARGELLATSNVVAVSVRGATAGADQLRTVTAVKAAKAKTLLSKIDTSEQTNAAIMDKPKVGGGTGGLRLQSSRGDRRLQASVCSNTGSSCSSDTDCTVITCSGGAAPGSTCTNTTPSSTDCPDVLTCAGGSREGLTCDESDNDCPAGGGICVGGSNPGTDCALDGDCPDVAPTCGGGVDVGKACPNGDNDCDDSLLCVGGARDGLTCTTMDNDVSTGCPDTTVGTCDNDGSVSCTAGAAECLISTCEGGLEPGGSCDTNDDCSNEKRCSNNNALCADASDCAASVGVCVGGHDAGDPCQIDDNCRDKNWKDPGVCNLGPPGTCDVVSQGNCITTQGTCQGLSAGTCTLDETGTCSAGSTGTCDGATAGSCVTTNAGTCVEETGTCDAVVQPTGVCSRNTGVDCSSDADCTDRRCIGGANDGLSCPNGDVDCPMDMRCDVGANAGNVCGSDGDCPPGGTCSGGSRDGLICTSQDKDTVTGCPDGDMVCASGRDSGKPCTTSFNCHANKHCLAEVGVCSGWDSSPSCVPSDTGFGYCAEEICQDFPTQTYGYKNTGSCTTRNGNVDPEDADTPSRSIVMQFWAFGDTPYDPAATSCAELDPIGTGMCDCGTSSLDPPTTPGTCSYDGFQYACNACTYEGGEYTCWQDTIIPWMNDNLQGKSNSDAHRAACAFHVGDLLKGNGNGNSGRCNEHSFDSRVNLYSAIQNFKVVPGDNDFNECDGFSDVSNTDAIKNMWRDKFADSPSVFSQFDSDFPLVDAGYQPKPVVHRQTTYNSETYPENFFFVHNGVAFFGLNKPAGWSGADAASAEWVASSLQNAHVTHGALFSSADHTCKTINSVIVVTHIGMPSGSLNAINTFFSACGRADLPILNIKGNSHPSKFELCEDGGTNEFTLTVEAFESGPLFVSILRDPLDPASHYFYVKDADTTNAGDENANNGNDCPNFPAAN